MYDILVLGSINMDIIVKCNHFPKSGDTSFCESIQMLPGGKGNNQAISAAKYNDNICFVGCIGDDSRGEQLQQNLKKYGVDNQYLLTTTEGETGSCVALIESSGENTLLVNTSANFCFGKKEVTQIFNKIDAKILLIQMETSKEAFETALKLAKEKGMYIILDPAPVDGIDLDLIHYADLVVPNVHETHHITGIKINNTDDALTAAKKIHAMGVKDVIVKMGGDGCLIYKDGKSTIIPAIPVKAVDTVGAGDCFAGALAGALIKDPDLLKAVQFATVAAGIKVSRFGGHNAIPSLEEVKQHLS